MFAINLKEQFLPLLASPMPLTILYNLALGKRASHSPFLEDNLTLAQDPSKAIDGNNATCYKIGGENRTIDNEDNVESYLKNREGYNPSVGLYEGIEYELWWEVDLEKEYLIQELIVHCDDMRSIYQIIIFDERDEVVFALNKATEANIKVPYVLGVKVRILFQRDSVLSTPLIPDYDVPNSVLLHNVMVIEAKLGPSVQVDIPLGRLRLGSITRDSNENTNKNGRDHNNDHDHEYGSFDHIGLVQSTAHSSTTSRISDIKLLYVSSEELN